MSKTFKHQKKYDSKAYWQSKRSETSFICVRDQDGELVGVKRLPPLPKDINEPDWRFSGMYVEVRRKKSIERSLQKKFRRKVKRLIHQGEYDLLPIKPEDSAWIIW